MPEQPHERIEARLLPKPVNPFRRCGAKLVDSEDEEELYVSRGIIYRVLILCVRVAIPRA